MQWLYWRIAGMYVGCPEAAMVGIQPALTACPPCTVRPQGCTRRQDSSSGLEAGEDCVESIPKHGQELAGDAGKALGRWAGMDWSSRPAADENFKQTPLNPECPPLCTVTVNFICQLARNLWIRLTLNLWTLNRQITLHNMSGPCLTSWRPE